METEQRGYNKPIVPTAAHEAALGAGSLAVPPTIIAPGDHNKTPSVSPEITGIRQELLNDIYANVSRGVVPGEEVEPGQERALARLFESLDPSLAEIADPVKRLERYEEICEEYFDFRKGRERAEVAQVLQQPREVVGEELWDAAFAAGAELGMVENSELSKGDRIRNLAILGGTAAGMSNRTKYAMEQLGKHGAVTGSLDFLVSEGEVGFAFDQAESLGVNVSPDALIDREERLDRIIFTLPSLELNGNLVPVRIFVHKDVVKPNGQTGRATTLDTMKLWVEAAGIRPGDRAVAVTTGLYTAFQKANAKEVVTWENGAVIGVIGHSADWANTTRTANQLLQEIKATVDSWYRSYQQAVASGLSSAE